MLLKYSYQNGSLNLEDFLLKLCFYCCIHLYSHWGKGLPNKYQISGFWVLYS